ncbi:MAG: carbohydrate ABC transporter permease [Clostridiales bacterium]|jgi:putative aldouronate transport system permease protein|nr:carbohydrate ABC transporter permease [Clostridiales bacterium]
MSGETGIKKPYSRGGGRLYKLQTMDYVILTLLTAFMLIILYPFYNALLISVVPQNDYVRQPLMLWPAAIETTNYEFVFDSPILLRSMLTSAVMMVVGTAYNMLLTVLFAYAMAKPIPGRNFFRFLMVFTLYFGGGLIPYYLLIKAIGLLDSFWVMILPSVISVTYMLIISNSISTLPVELFESASLDGAGEMRILFQIVLPLSLPILATFTLYYAVERWNEWYSAMLFIKSIEKWPLQYALRKIISDANFVSTQAMTGEFRPPTYGEGIKMACVVVTVFPLMAVYPFLQRYFLTGLTAGSVKG